MYPKKVQEFKFRTAAHDFAEVKQIQARAPITWPCQVKKENHVRTSKQCRCFGATAPAPFTE